MPVNRVFSAGGIVLKTGSDGQKVLVTQHSGHKGWDFPKGHVEVGESMQDAAKREVEEETGVNAEIIKRVGDTKYFYWESGEKIFKTVTFYLMKFLDQGEATTAFEVSEIKWLPIGEVEKQLTFKDTKVLWQKANAMIKSLS